MTRRLVLQACAAEGIPCFEEAVPATVLQHCEEAFLTSTTRDVHPIEQAGDHAMPAPGPITRLVMDAFARLAEKMRIASHAPA